MQKGGFGRGDPQENAKITLGILNGEKGPKRDAVLLNSAACIYMVNDNMTMKDAVKKAAELIDSGQALNQLERFIQLSNEM